MPDIVPKLWRLLRHSKNWKQNQPPLEVAQFQALNMMWTYPTYHTQWLTSREQAKWSKKENNKSHPLFVSAFKFNAQIWGLTPSYLSRELKHFSFPIESGNGCNSGTHLELKIRLNGCEALSTSPEEISGAISIPVHKCNHTSCMSSMSLSLPLQLCKLLWKYLNRAWKTK